MHSWIISKYIVKKVKVRVVTTAIDYDNTPFSILGVIEKYEKQGILLKDKNNKEQFICYPNILEVQYLGTDDWSEYERQTILDENEYQEYKKAYRAFDSAVRRTLEKQQKKIW